MVEFLLVLLPVLTLATSTIGLCWYAVERVSLRILVTQAAWQLSEPDIEPSDLQEFVASGLQREIGMNRFSMEADRVGNRASVSVLLDQLALPGDLGLVVPELRVNSHASLAD